MKETCERMAPTRRHRSGGVDVVIFGVRFDRLTREEALSAMESAFGSRQAIKVYIPNAHTLNLACSDPQFRRVLNEADLLLNDGRGVHIASWLAGQSFHDNLVGTDLTPEFCERAARSGVSVFLLGGESGIAEMAAEGLRRKIKSVVIAGVHHGYFSEADEALVVDRINRSGAGILLVGFGNPLQELWIHRNADRLRCDVCIGVGGLFDHLSGRLKRAPLWIRRMGMEWAFILYCQPQKWRRYLLGIPLFLFRLFRDRLTRVQSKWRPL